MIVTKNYLSLSVICTTQLFKFLIKYCKKTPYQVITYYVIHVNRKHTKVEHIKSQITEYIFLIFYCNQFSLINLEDWPGFS